MTHTDASINKIITIKSSRIKGSAVITVIGSLFVGLRFETLTGVFSSAAVE